MLDVTTLKPNYFQNTFLEYVIKLIIKDHRAGKTQGIYLKVLIKLKTQKSIITWSLYLNQ